MCAKTEKLGRRFSVTLSVDTLYNPKTEIICCQNRIAKTYFWRSNYDWFGARNEMEETGNLEGKQNKNYYFF